MSVQSEIDRITGLRTDIAHKLVTIGAVPASNTLEACKDAIEGMTSPVDYVLDTGTSAGWDYIKWNSGKIELSLMKTQTWTINTKWGQIYEPSSSKTMPALPTNLGGTITVSSIELDGWGTTSAIMGWERANSGTTYYPLRATSASNLPVVEIWHVTGTI